MPRPEIDHDSQESAETWDETHLDDEGDGDTPFDLAEKVFDTTRAERGYGSDEGFRQAAEDDGPEADSAPDEIELRYTDKIEDLRGAQGSAGHFEPRRPLADDDIEALGYADPEQD